MLHTRRRGSAGCVGQADRQGCPGWCALQGPEVWVRGSREVSRAFAQERSPISLDWWMQRLVLGCDLLLQLGVLGKLQSGVVTGAELSLGP